MLRKVSAPKVEFIAILTLPLIALLNLVTVLVELRVSRLRKGFWRWSHRSKYVHSELKAIWPPSMPSYFPCHHLNCYHLRHCHLFDSPLDRAFLQLQYLSSVPKEFQLWTFVDYYEVRQVWKRRAGCPQCWYLSTHVKDSLRLVLVCPNQQFVGSYLWPFIPLYRALKAPL